MNHKSKFDILLPKKLKYNRIYAFSIAWYVVKTFQIMAFVMGFIGLQVLLCLMAG